jgi:uncharacterized protein YndB with AHSA1/START domain
MTSTENHLVRIERTIAASPHKVYRAWLDPTLLVRWLAPGTSEVTRVEVEEKVGGHFRVWQANSGRASGGFDCEFLELVPDQRIALRWGFVGPERRDGPAFDSLLTITLKEGSTGDTLLVLVHERLDDLFQAMPDVAKNVEFGWNLVLEKLDNLLVRKPS